MNYESLETKLIRQQNQYIKQLEEQLSVYKEKDKVQEELILKLTAQVNHNYESSSLPSCKCIGRKKITNNREKYLPFTICERNF